MVTELVGLHSLKQVDKQDMGDRSEVLEGCGKVVSEGLHSDAQSRTSAEQDVESEEVLS